VQRGQKKEKEKKVLPKIKEVLPKYSHFRKVYGILG
jgi:hypothetical protein